MKKTELEIETDYYFDLLVHYIREENCNLNFDMQDIYNQNDVLKNIHKTISKVIQVNRTYLLTNDYLNYIASIYRSNVKDYLWEIRDRLYHLSSISDELAISEIYDYYEFLYVVKHEKVTNLKSVENVNEFLINNIKIKNKLIDINCIMQMLNSNHPNFKYQQMIYETILIVLSYCTFYKIDFNMYQNYIANIACNPEQYIEKLYLNGIIEMNDDYKVEDQRLYFLRLLKYILATIDTTLIGQKRIK